MFGRCGSSIVSDGGSWLAGNKKRCAPLALLFSSPLENDPGARYAPASDPAAWRCQKRLCTEVCELALVAVALACGGLLF